MSGATAAIAALTRIKATFTLHEYEHTGGAGYGEEAAAALGVDPARMYKTLIVASSADGGGKLAVGVVPVAGTLDLKAIAAALKTKSVRMAEAADAERATGYVLGGISPLGQRKQLPTVIDETVTGWPTVFVSAGRRGLQVELEPAALVALTRAGLARIGRPG
jgi:Cys-tRNA(Pro)/Cys-tRNA(Cys) deacylase